MHRENNGEGSHIMLYSRGSGLIKILGESSAPHIHISRRTAASGYLAREKQEQLNDIKKIGRPDHHGQFAW